MIVLTFILDLLSWVCLLAGGAFLVIGALGLIRLPDFFTRLHAAGVIDTLGAGLILLGLAFQAGPTLVMVKLVMIFAFLFLTGPAASHALAKAALHGGHRPFLHHDRDTPSSKP